MLSLALDSSMPTESGTVAGGHDRWMCDGSGNASENAVGSRSALAAESSLPTAPASSSDAIQIFILRRSASTAGPPVEHSLSEDERSRAGKFVRESDRHSFVVARGLLRRVLGHRLGVRPETIIFALSHYGKPRLAHPEACDITFNVSHADGMVAVVVGSSHRRVGIDIEQRGREINVTRLASYLHTQEAAHLAATPRARRGDEFLRLWTRKEAVVKADGRGLSCSLDTFHVLSDRQRVWTISDLDLADDYIGAVAYECDGRLPPLKIYRLG